MKILILSGGLGNQMFEYAFFLSCKKRGINIKMNRDLYEVVNMHGGYLLHDVFGVPEEDVTHSSVFSVFLTRILRRYNPFGLVYKETPLTFCADAFSTNRLIYDGCFIEPRYFEAIEDTIREAFVFKNIDHNNLSLREKMLCDNSVSIHIRRGDFLNNSIYAVCNESYYVKAIEFILSKVTDPFYYVFSDDPDWCELFMSKMGVNYQIMSQNTGLNSYKDMYLMTQCRHNIIANSTFSWWGAWLNDSKDKIVVSPNKWTISNFMDYTSPNWAYIGV